MRAKMNSSSASGRPAAQGVAEALAARDLRVVWHPCTQMKDHESLPPIAIRRGHGAWLEDFGGKRYLDAVSSWWVNLFGHANPRIAAALTDQAGTLEHVIFAGFTHEPAVRLAERLVAITPPGLSRCFFADNGSAAVEVALKMSFHYWRNKGETRKTRFIALANGYHGETLGALAVGNVDLYKSLYDPLLMDVIMAPSPDCYRRESGRVLGRSFAAAVRAHGAPPRASTRTRWRRSSSNRSCNAPAACACITRCTSRACARPAAVTACI